MDGAGQHLQQGTWSREEQAASRRKGAHPENVTELLQVLEKEK